MISTVLITMAITSQYLYKIERDPNQTLDPKTKVEIMVSNKINVEGAILNRIVNAFTQFRIKYPNITIQQCDFTYRKHENYYIIGIIPNIETDSKNSNEIKLIRGTEMLFHISEETKCLKEIKMK